MFYRINSKQFNAISVEMIGWLLTCLFIKQKYQLSYGAHLFQYEGLCSIW